MLGPEGAMGWLFDAELSAGRKQGAESRCCARGRARTGVGIGPGAELPVGRCLAERCELGQLAVQERGRPRPQRLANMVATLLVARGVMGAAVRCVDWGWLEAGCKITSLRPGTGADRNGD